MGDRLGIHSAVDILLFDTKNPQDPGSSPRCENFFSPFFTLTQRSKCPKTWMSPSEGFPPLKNGPLARKTPNGPVELF